MTGRLLIVDDDTDMCQMLHDDLARRGHASQWRTDADEAFALFMAEPFDTVITDLRMPGLNGIEFCRRLAQNRPDIPVIVITAFGSLDTAVEALRAGAYDFVVKPIDRDMLAIATERALQHRALQEQVRFLKQARKVTGEFGEFIGRSRCMEHLFEQISRMADEPMPVVITGESGTGKELVARALHRHSGRCDRPFIPVNCAAITATLLESELFGHTRGAFTGARSDRQGLFLAADGGTLFLDEIAEIPLELQPKLLRALETRRIRPVGRSDEVECDVRVLAATNRDLEAAVEEGDFREDLFFRINVLRIEVPPLRSRGSDVLRLAQAFIQDVSQRSGKSIKGLSRGAAEKLLAYRWPGNVRELRNAVEHAMALTRIDELAVEDLPARIRDYQPPQITPAGVEVPEGLLPLDEIERRYVQHVLEQLDGNKAAAARVLGLGRRTLYRKLDSWGL